MTDEIRQLMGQRRKKNDDDSAYNSINIVFKGKVRETKERDKCTEIETLQAKHDTFTLHLKTKELTLL